MNVDRTAIAKQVKATDSAEYQPTFPLLLGLHRNGRRGFFSFWIVAEPWRAMKRKEARFYFISSAYIERDERGSTSGLFVHPFLPSFRSPPVSSHQHHYTVQKKKKRP